MSRSERDKMLAGEPYRPGGPQIDLAPLEQRHDLVGLGAERDVD